MYGIDKSADLSFLMERELIQVAIGLYQVIFAFDGNISISVENRFEIHTCEAESIWVPGEPEHAAAALGLLGSKISETSSSTDGTLSLKFAKGDSLRIFDLSGERESYEIIHPGGRIVV